MNHETEAVSLRGQTHPDAENHDEGFSALSTPTGIQADDVIEQHQNSSQSHQDSNQSHVISTLGGPIQETNPGHRGAFSH